MFENAMIEVVPITTLIEPAGVPRTPVACTSRIVGTGDPPGLGGVVTSKGSGIHPGTVGSVILQIEARPFGPLVDVKISGCAATRVILPRITVPLLLITRG